MDKKDIYEHLAKIYLDTPLKTEKRIKEYPPRISRRLLFSLIAVSALIVLLIGAFLLDRKKQAAALNTSFSHLITQEAAKVDFNFDPAKKAIYAIDLNKLNCAGYKTLEFSLKKSEYNDSLAVRVEFANTFQEKSEIYLRDISHHWKHYKIELVDFKNITDWSEMVSLSFIVEEWNSTASKGALFVDNVKLGK